MTKSGRGGGELWPRTPQPMAAVGRSVCDPKAAIHANDHERPLRVGLSLSTGAISTPANVRDWLLADEIDHPPKRPV